jgi:hypothetical protein
MDGEGEVLRLGRDLDLERQAASARGVEDPYRRSATPHVDEDTRSSDTNDSAETRSGPRLEGSPRHIDGNAFHQPSAVPETPDPARDVDRAAQMGARDTELRDKGTSQGERS